MDISAIVDVFIGLILLYLVLSLMCTTLNEFIATALKLRATNLSRAVTQLIDDEKIREAFYNHGLISGAKTASRGGEPSKGAETKGEAQPKDTHHPSYFDGRTFAMALLASLDPEKRNASFALADLESQIEKLEPSGLKDVLLANLATADRNLVKLRDNIAEWFDSAMDRLSGSFTRNMKWISLGVGIAIAAALNADSMSVGRSIWNDQVLRGQIADAANTALMASPDAFNQKCLKQDPPNEDKQRPPEQQMNCQVQLLATEAQGLRVFPIGWPDRDVPALKQGEQIQYRALLGYGLLKLLGIVWTGLALSLGAPFWFDLLQKFVNIRGAGTKPKETRTANAG